MGIAALVPHIQRQDDHTQILTHTERGGEGEEAATGNNLCVLHPESAYGGKH